MLPLMFGLLSPEEAAELQLQQAYLAFLWGRAALMGVEPQASRLTANISSRIRKQTVLAGGGTFSHQNHMCVL